MGDRLGIHGAVDILPQQVGQSSFCSNRSKRQSCLCRMVLANWDISGRPREDSPERNYYYLQSATQTRISLVKGERYIRSVWMTEMILTLRLF